ncbi:hypothetical protein GRI39_02100 [Altererythrobacter indicus]|uniref:Uncharacterized protein n=1 Tax=Altericroceibacterium indicum TaxID=374177 RepID=A0A845A653_9SPHN|nr:hypothetical protein [Altericroceibacterium indicum]
MRTHAQIVREAGKPADVATRRNVSVHTVRSWIRRNSVPQEHWLAFRDDGWASLDELAVGAAAQSAEAEAVA